MRDVTRDTIKAIPTKYKGVTFRSKMESLFAKWCDEYKQKWLYEPEGFVLNGECYLPDFYLPNSKMIVEIKPAFFDKETRKMDIILHSEDFNKFTLAVIEMTSNLSLLKYTSTNYLDPFGEKRVWEREILWFGFCNKCGAFGVCGQGSWKCNGCGFYDGDNTISHHTYCM